MIRAELEPLPAHMAHLPVHRGYPVPWFVEWVLDTDDGVAPAPLGEGTPRFEIMSSLRHTLAIAEQRCWCCGGKLGSHRAFVIGPMCAVNRTSAEPPSHTDCAQWSARNCPFLSRPHQKRRQAQIEGTVEAPGIALARNPGVALVWITKAGRYKPYRAPGGGILFDIGEPASVTWWCEGRPATRAEVQASIDSGLPSLRELACEPSEALALDRCVQRATKLLPA